MRIVFMNAHLDQAARTPLELLAAWPTLVDVPTAVQATGATVHVVQAALGNEQITRGEVTYHFIEATRAAARRFASAVAALRPDVIHVNSFAFPGHVLALRAALPHTPILVQDHKDAPPPVWRRTAWRQALRNVDAFAFTAAAQAEPFIRAGVSPRARVFAIPESSSHFTPGNAAAARSALSMYGNPCVVSVGRLNAVKDPRTLLHGFAEAVTSLPDPHLWLCYSDASLHAEVDQVVATDPRLHGRVHLLGRLPHAHIEVLLQAADMFVTASRAEGSGYALIEALACGVPPIASDIPPHRALLDNGRIGALFPCGDARALSAALLAVAPSAADARCAVRRHFEDELSFGAVGRQLVSAYETVRAARATTAIPRTSRGRRLRVAFITPGGVDRSGVMRVIPRYLWLIERLAAEVDLHVIALRQEEQACTYELLGATVHCLPASASRARTLRLLLELQRVHAFDVLEALWMHPQGTMAGIVGALTRRPVLLHLEGGDLAAVRDIGFGGRVSARGRMWLQAATRGASHITVSSALLQHDAAALGIQTELLSCGVALDRWPVREPPKRAADGPARLIHVGTINRVKDHETLLRALSSMHAAGVRFEADLIGEDTLNGEMHRAARELGVDSVVHFRGWMPHDETRPYFDRAHLQIISSRFEGGPFVLHEAAVAGVPTVGTAVGDLLDWAPAAAVTVPVGDAAALARAAAALLRDEAARYRLAVAAQQRALITDADASAQRVLELHEILASRRRAPASA